MEYEVPPLMKVHDVVVVAVVVERVWNTKRRRQMLTLSSIEASAAS
jgi:hypothetical protein